MSGHCQPPLSGLSPQLPPVEAERTEQPEFGSCSVPLSQKWGPLEPWNRILQDKGEKAPGPGNDDCCVTRSRLLPPGTCCRPGWARQSGHESNLLVCS